MNNINRSSDYSFHGGADSVELSNPFNYPDEITDCLQAIINTVIKKNSIHMQLKTILQDLDDIRQKSDSAYHTVKLAVTMYPASYSQIAKAKNVSKQMIHKQLKRLAEQYHWINTLFCLMSEYDKKVLGQKNRGVR